MPGRRLTSGRGTVEASPQHGPLWRVRIAPVSYMGKMLYVLIALSLVAALPLVGAESEDDEELYEGQVDEDTCYAINPNWTPPIAIYQCPADG